MEPTQSGSTENSKELVLDASVNDKPHEPMQDHSVLHSPINLGSKNVKQIIGALKDGTREVKDVLFNECNIIYECKICSNLFRCLANLLAHKRFYCKEKKGVIPEFRTELTDEEKIIVIEPLSVSDEEQDPSDEEIIGSDHEMETEFKVPEVPLSSPKIFEPRKQSSLNKFAGITRNAPFSPKGQMISLHPITGNSNVKLQAITKRDIAIPHKVVKDENTKPCAVQLKKIEPKDKLPPRKITVNKAATVTKDNPLANRDDCDSKKMICLRCNIKFSAFKSLYSHMTIVHATKRLHFPCPICNTTFLKIQSVKRHLISNHKKTSQQIEKLKDTIRRKAYYKKVTGSSQSKESKTVTKVSKSHWHKCRICQRSFDRKSSQISHEKACLRAKANQSGNKPIKPSVVPGSKRCGQCRRYYSPFEAECICKKTSFVTNKRLPTRSVLATSSTSSSSGTVTTRPKRITNKKENKDFVDSQSLKWRSANCVESVTMNKDKSVSIESAGLPAAIERRLLVFMNAKRNSCLKCCRKFSSISNLRRHIATHIQWTRYACRYNCKTATTLFVCNYRSFDRADVKTHIEKNHTEVPSKKVDSMIDQVHRLSSIQSAVNTPKDTAVKRPSSKVEPIIRPTKLKSSPTSSRSLSNTIQTLTSRMQASPKVIFKKEIEDLFTMGSSTNETVIPDIEPEECKNEYAEGTDINIKQHNARMGTTTKPIITTLIRKDFLTQMNRNEEDRLANLLEQQAQQDKINTSRSNTDSPILCSVLTVKEENSPNNSLKGFTTLVTRSGTYQKKITNEPSQL